jgi:Lethal giant larvae(Lgl) like, C-terminal
MDGSLIVVDMRGPKIIFSHESNNKKNKPKRPSIHSRTHGGDGPTSPSSGLDIAKSLTWTISPLDKGK